MHREFSFYATVLVACLFFLLAPIESVATGQTTYKPGQRIEYKTQTYPNEKWEVGTVESMTPSGKQVIIREKPNQFYPTGNTKAYSLDEVRPLGARPLNQREEEPRRDALKSGGNTVGEVAGLMSQDEILSFLRDRMGDKPFSVESSQREQIFTSLAQMIMRRGVNFRYQSLGEFSNALGRFGAPSTVIFPIQGNYGPPPEQRWLMGSWDTTVVSVGRRVIIGANAGALTINANGSYVWKLYPRDPSAKYVRGTWRKASVTEMQAAPSYRGGDGIVLLNGKSGLDWIVTKDRVTTLPGEWVDIADLNTRQLHEGGKRR
jgi:hypothetical protein